jgi:hypothetical protein
MGTSRDRGSGYSNASQSPAALSGGLCSVMGPLHQSGPLQALLAAAPWDSAHAWLLKLFRCLASDAGLR